MAVLKSPKNNRTKKLWARRELTPIKKVSNHFYSYENQQTKSNLKSFGIKYDFTLDPKKYRFIGDVHKEEKRLLGEILPSTLLKPKPIRPLKTISSKEWSKRSTFQKEFFMFANTDHFNITNKSTKLDIHFAQSRKFGEIRKKSNVIPELVESRLAITPTLKAPTIQSAPSIPKSIVNTAVDSARMLKTKFSSFFIAYLNNFFLWLHVTHWIRY